MNISRDVTKAKKVKVIHCARQRRRRNSNDVLQTKRAYDLIDFKFKFKFNDVDVQKKFYWVFTPIFGIHTEL